MGKVYSVSQVNKYIKLVLDDDILLDKIKIEGEISNIKHHTSGHIYFTLKDEECSIIAIIYKDKDIPFKEKLRDGQKIICYSKISSYARTGQTQVIVEDILNTGIGNIYTDFENLKNKLKDEGLFDKVYKMDLPYMPKIIGIITSETGAGLRDMIKVAKSLNKNVRLIIIPSLMQGENAPDSIIDAIELANEYKKLDIIILARGGGSKEDLYCFNNENLARAIFYSSIPIVTGIGHETDFTIADFVADFRAPTPSSAIEICLRNFKNIKQEVEFNINMIHKAINKKILYKKLYLEKIISGYNINIIRQKILQLKELNNRYIIEIDKNLNVKIDKNKNIVSNLMDKIDDNSPSRILKKGYVSVSNENGKQIKKSQQLNQNDIINIEFFDGIKRAQILE